MGGRDAEAIRKSPVGADGQQSPGRSRLGGTWVSEPAWELPGQLDVLPAAGGLGDGLPLRILAALVAGVSGA